MGTVFYNSDVPDLLRGATPDLIALFGLDDWDLRITMDDAVIENGSCNADPGTGHAVVSIERDISAIPQHQALQRSLMAVALSPLTVAAASVIGELPAEAQSLARSLVSQAERTALESLRRALDVAGAIPIIAEGPVIP